MHTAFKEHHSRVDSVQISIEAQQLSTHEMLDRAEREGHPVVMLGPDGQGGPDAALIVIILVAMALGCAAFGLLVWITGSVGNGIFVGSLLLIVCGLICAWNDQPNNGKVKL